MKFLYILIPILGVLYFFFRNQNRSDDDFLNMPQAQVNESVAQQLSASQPIQKNAVQQLNELNAVRVSKTETKIGNTTVRHQESATPETILKQYQSFSALRENIGNRSRRRAGSPLK